MLDSTNVYGNLDIERQVLHLLLTEVDTFREGITKNHFTDDLHQLLFELASTYYTEFGRLLTESTLVAELDNNPFAGSDSTGELIRHVVDMFKGVLATPVASKEFAIRKLKVLERSRALLMSITHVHNLFENDQQEEAIAFWQQSALSDVSLDTFVERGEYIERVDERIIELVDRKEHPEKYRGVQTGLPSLDTVLDMTSGVIGVIFGETSVGKTWLLQQFALGGFQAKKRVLVISPEVTRHLWERRLDSKVTHISGDALKSGDLSSREWTLYRKRMADLKRFCYDRGARLYIQYVPANCNTAYIRRELLAFDPPIELLIVDEMDMMEDMESGLSLFESGFHKIRALKALAGEFGLPLWVATQRQRTSYGQGEISLSEIASSIGKARVADIVLGLTLGDSSGNLRTLGLTILKNRDGRAGMVIQLSADFEFGEIRELPQQSQLQPQWQSARRTV